VRYANLDQDLHSEFSILGSTRVDTEIDFDGVGPRIGLDGELRLQRGWLMYGRSVASFMAGEFRRDFRQSNVLTGPLATVAVADDRIVSQLELELGLGWRNSRGTFRILAGYSLGAWFNTMTTASLIEGVQAGEFDHLDATLLFDGLTGRIEVRF